MPKMRILFIYLVFLGFVFGQTGYEIAKKLDEKIKPKNMVSKTTMILTNSRGKTRKSTMISKTMDNSKRQLIWFLEPKDDKGIAFLKKEYDNRDDEMRIWLPDFKRIRRISAKKKGDSFMGSDLSYEDMTSRSLNENKYERLDDTSVNGKDCFVLEVIPNSSQKSSYSKHKIWIAKDDLFIVREESYDKRGKLKKEKNFKYQKIGNYDVLTELSVKDIQKDHRTDILFKQIRVDIDMDEKIFQEKSLKRLPIH